MTTYEYQTVKVNRGRKSYDATMNAYAADGWEMVNVRDAWQKHVTVTLRRDTSHPAALRPKAPTLLGLIFGALTRNRTAK
ncbi:hypothetical protein HYQ19_gp099 [Arthrobacter phage DrYang]|uniref:DUF4177 domain-containing protein n=1 Tax=Arthrobacter phage DrYang TaxID=2686080 RepID=A0A6B9J8J1_9CAUD|nr:hypothetical protein HYQ19_gp099 [Arthrobacter phage DrYang]QGZ17198.1 hypothetical protein SEA_DRYANG_99 [Arthrobacter phage DrYang]